MTQPLDILEQMKIALDDAYAAGARNAQRQWVGLDWHEMPEIYMNDKAFEHGAQWAEAKLREKNTKE